MATSIDKRFRHNTISSLIWSLLERGGNQAVTLLVQVVMARLLAPEDFGSLAIMLVFVNVGGVFVTSGLNTALIQDPDVSSDDYSTVFWMSLTISIVLYGLIFITAPAIAGFYASPSLVWPLRILCLILPINAYNAVQVAFVRRRLEFKKIFKSSILSVMLSGALGVASALLGAGLWALVIQQVSYQLSNCVTMAAQVPWRPRIYFSLSRASTLFRFSWKLLVSSTLSSVYNSLTDLVIGRQFSTTQLGYVNQGSKYPKALGSLLDGAIQPVMMSAVARVQDDVVQVRKIVRRALKTSTFLVIPAMSLFALVAPSLVPILLGSQWIPSIPYLQIYCVVYAMLPIHTTNLQALNGMGRSDLFLKLELIKKIYGVVWIAIAALIAKDVYFMVVGYVITGLLSTVVNAWPNRRVIRYSYRQQVRDLAPALGLTAFSLGIAWLPSFVMEAGLPLMLIQIIVFCVTYLGASWLFRVEELWYLLSTLKSFVSSR